MRKRVGIILMITGVFMLVCSFLLVLHNGKEERMAEQAVSVIQPAVEEKIKENASVAEKSKRKKEVEFDGNLYIGYLKIPTLDLKLPVMKEWSYEKLRISPCRYVGSIEENNIVIAAHNYSRHFGQIMTLNEGEPVEFVDALGYSYKYKVSEVLELEATAVEEMTNSDADLTLFTCTYGGRARVTVRCEKT